jgi:hypothetical protein
MTPTEDLLTRTLAQEAATITRESLLPLTEPANGKQLLSSGLHHFAQRRLRPLAAVAAAFSVLAVIGLVVRARSMFTVAPPFANVGTATSPPRYYVEIDENDQILVQFTATGQRTDLVKVPFAWSGGVRQDAAVGVSADGRTYVVAYNDWDALRTRLYRFTVTSGGQVADFAQIRSPRLPGLTEPSLAISANGTQLALAGIPDKSRSIEPSSGPPRLLVVNLRTGQVRTWHGLAGTGATDSIEDPAWMADGTLRFLVATCHGSRVAPANASCEYSGPASREWTVTVPRSSGPLGSGRVLVNLPGVTVQAQSSPGGDSVTALQLLRSGRIRVARYQAPTGQLLQTLYLGTGAKSNDSFAGLAVERSGRYLLINEDLGSFFGWIREGQFHKLPIRAPFGNNVIVAATW